MVSITYLSSSPQLNRQKNTIQMKNKTQTAVINILNLHNTSAIADHVKATGHNIKWDHFDILAKGKTDYHCKIKETLYIQELEPAFNVNVGSEKLMLY